MTFDEFGYLPEGEHAATWDDIVRLFGQGEHRALMLTGLLDLLQVLGRARVRDVWLDGSFTTTDPTPRDIDVCWSPSGADKAALPREFGYSSDAALDPSVPNHEFLRQRFGGDVWVHIPPYADWVAQFCEDREGRRRGVIKIEMESVP